LHGRRALNGRQVGGVWVQYGYRGYWEVDLEYNLAAIRELIDSSLDAEELIKFCREHFKVVYSQYASGHPKSTVVEKLLDFARRWGGMEKLLGEIEKTNPAQYAQFELRVRLTGDNHPYSRISNGGLTFTNIAIEESNLYWEEASSPPDYYLFNRTCEQYFRWEEYAPNVNPSFGVTVINNEPAPLLVTELGIEVVSVAHILILMASIEGGKDIEGDRYSLEIPDIWKRLEEYWDPAKLEGLEVKEPVDLRELVFMRVPDPVSVEAHGSFRYRLELEKYHSHMPSHAVLRFWVKTGVGENWSHEIHVSPI
jgi:hypothetical protein